MKRLLILLLAVAMLAGCKKQTPVPETTEPSAPEEELGLYVPNSPIEQGTDGAVRMYQLPKDSYFNLTAIGGHAVVMGQKTAIMLSGENAQTVLALETEDYSTASVIDTHATGIAYYLPNTREVVVQNPQLQEVSRRELPEGIVGRPVISLTKYEVYYSTGVEIRALNLNTGISRLLRQQTTANLSLMDAYFNDDVLLCQITGESGATQLVYVSTETGQTLNGGQGISSLRTNGTEYFADWLDGTLRQWVFGVRGGESKSFLAPAVPEGKRGGVMPLLAMHGVVSYVETDGGLEMSYYNLNTGKRTAQVFLPGLITPTKIHTDGTCIWILSSAEEQALYRWDISKSSITDEANYVAPLYTASNPDTQGLEQCRKTADALQKKYGVKLVLWQDAVARTNGHTLVAEYKPQVINAKLKEAETLLSGFPENFLLKTVEKGWLQIAFVQSIDGGTDWVQFWEDGDCWILISAKADTVKAMIQGIAYGIDSHIIGNSRKYDTWNQLNPAGFDYSYGNKVEPKPEYLDPATRSFVDEIAMTYPHEDRCRIFYQAMLPDNGEMFASKTMQDKLYRVCAGIREAYGLEKKTETYPWEQYLQTPLA